MGKRLIQQRRGRGSPTYRSPSHRYFAKVQYPKKSESVNGKIVDIIKCPGHTGPLMLVEFDSGEDVVMIAPEGIRVGSPIQTGKPASPTAGNILHLKDIPEGIPIYNIENKPGDGGKFVRSSGTFARVVIRTKDKILVQLPSKKKKSFNPECRAIVGITAGSGRKEKPFLKAGNKYKAMKAKNKLYPIVSGTSMNSVDHPFGGTKSSHKGKPLTPPKNAPPGRKVGTLKPARTGRKKR